LAADNLRLAADIAADCEVGPGGTGRVGVRSVSRICSFLVFTAMDEVEIGWGGGRLTVVMVVGREVAPLRITFRISSFEGLATAAPGTIPERELRPNRPLKKGSVFGLRGMCGLFRWRCVASRIWSAVIVADRGGRFKDRPVRSAGGPRVAHAGAARSFGSRTRL
jgi:hypothetical protein